MGFTIQILLMSSAFCPSNTSVMSQARNFSQIRLRETGVDVDTDNGDPCSGLCVLFFPQVAEVLGSCEIPYSLW